MGVIVDVAVPVFAIMLLGYLAGRAGILGDESSKALNAFVYWFALPPLLFLSRPAQRPKCCNPRALRFQPVWIFPGAGN